MARKKKRDAEEAGFTGEASPERVRLTPVDVQQKVFRIGFRGYNERDVDAFLDSVTEELAALHEENKRLRESGGAAAGGGAGAQRQAEEIVRQAREHAARLIEDAERAGGTTGGGLPTSFLLGERAFLQRLASSVQEHARWLKQEARRTQAAAPAQEAAPAPEQPKRKGKAKSETPPPEPAPEPEPSPPAPAQEPSSMAAPAAAAGAVAAEQTAAWGPPQEGMAEPSPGWSSQEAPPGESDPLLSAWESAFTDSAAPAPQPAPGSEQEGEPSLRELFWGEE
jgi:DivIVA domain-containing protein